MTTEAETTRGTCGVHDDTFLINTMQCDDCNRAVMQAVPRSVSASVSSSASKTGGLAMRFSR